MNHRIQDHSVGGWLNRALYGLCGIAMAVLPLSCQQASSRESAGFMKKERLAVINRTMISQGESLLQDGDLVLRTGNDFISLTLRQFSQQDKTYSHCGIVRKEKGHFFVYHAIGGEDNPKATLRKDTFEDFCDPVHNTGFAIYRYQLAAGANRRLDSIVSLLYRRKTQFDLNFDLNTDDQMYCAEFVYKAFTRADHKLKDLPVSHLGSFTYVAIDNLYVNPHTRYIYQTVYH